MKSYVEVRSLGKRLKALINMNLNMFSLFHVHECPNSCIATCIIQVHDSNEVLVFLLSIMIFFHGTSHDLLPTKTRSIIYIKTNYLLKMLWIQNFIRTKKAHKTQWKPSQNKTKITMKHKLNEPPIMLS